MIIKQFDEVRKDSTGQGDEYTAGYLLDSAYFRDHKRLIAVVLSKQKALDTNPFKINSTNIISRSCWKSWWYKNKIMHYPLKI